MSAVLEESKLLLAACSCRGGIGWELGAVRGCLVEIYIYIYYFFSFFLERKEYFVPGSYCRGAAITLQSEEGNKVGRSGDYLCLPCSQRDFSPDF